MSKGKGGVPSAFDEAFHAAEVAARDKRWENAKKHYAAALKEVVSNPQRSQVNYGLAICAKGLREDWGQFARLAAMFDQSSTKAVDLHIKFLESKQEWVQVHDWLKIRLKYTKDEADKQLILRKVAEAEKSAGIAQRSDQLKRRYQSFKALRWDVARTFAQTALRGLQPGDAYHLVPSEYLDSWKAHVGGFATNKDSVAWMRIIKASGKTSLPPTDPLVLYHYGQSGISDIIPTADELAGAQSAGTPPTPPAPEPGPIDCRSLLALGPNADDAPDSDGKMGPRLRSDVDLEGIEVISEETRNILQFVYGSIGPFVKRYVVPEVPGDNSKCTIDFFPELERYSGLGAGSADSDVESQPATIGGSDDENENAGAGAGASSPSAATKLGPCAVCQKPCDNKCTKCKAVRYCNEDCQRKAWAKHKTECADLAKQVQSGQLKRAVTDRNGKVGLNNLGNTCFMNSSLQALSSVWPLTSYFIRDEWRQDLNPANPMGSKDNVLAKCYAGLMNKMWLTQAASVSPAEFKSSIAKFQHRFSGFQQHDAQELLNFLLDGLHEDLNGILKKPYVDDVDSNGRPDALVAALSWERYCRRNKSRLLDLFAAQLKSTLVCPTCQKVSVKFDPYWAVPLPIPKPGEDKASSYPQYIDVWLRRMAWEPAMLEQWSRERAGTRGADGDFDAWATVRKLAPEQMPKGWDKDPEAVTRQGQHSVGISAAFTSPYRFERYAVRVDSEDTTTDQFLGRLSELCGISPDRLLLQSLRAASNHNQAGVSLSAYRFLGTPFTDGASRPLVHMKTNPQSTFFANMDTLQAVELPDPAWRMQDAAIPEALLRTWPGSEAEEAATTELLSAKGEVALDRAKAAFLSTRHPGRLVTIVMNVYLPGVPKDVHSEGLYSACDKFEQALPRSSNTTVPLVVRMPGTATVAQFRLALAKELFFMLEASARALVKQQQAAGADPEEVDVTVADVLLCIASSLHIFCLSSPEGQGPWLPLMDGKGQDAPAPAGAATGSGAERSANNATLLDCMRMQVYEDNGRVSPSFVWSRVAVQVRGSLANMAWNYTQKYVRMPLSQDLLAETPSFRAAARIVDEEFEASKRGVPLTQCFDRLRRGEILDKDNMWYCGHCKEHKQAEKKLEIWSLPDFLVLQLKRFDTRGNYGIRVAKVDTLVNFPLRGLDLSSFHTSQMPENASFDVVAHAPGDLPQPLPQPVPPHPDNSTYDCVAIVNHFGSAYGGHYTAFANHAVGERGAASDPGVWLNFDDSRVSVVGPEGAGVVSTAAYVLVYRRRKQHCRPV